MTVGTIRPPLVLLAAKCHRRDGPGEDPACPIDIAEGDADRVRIGLVFVDQHQRPVAIWTRYSIGGDQNVAGGVLQIAGRGIKFVHPGTMLHPLQIDQPARVVLRGEGLDVEIRQRATGKMKCPGRQPGVQVLQKNVMG